MFCYYSLVPDLDEDSPSSKSDVSDQEDGQISVINLKTIAKVAVTAGTINTSASATITTTSASIQKTQLLSSSNSSAEDDELGDGLRSTTSGIGLPVHHGHVQHGGVPPQLARTNSLPYIPGQTERRRRKLPEIPKNKKCE